MKRFGYGRTSEPRVLSSRPLDRRPRVPSSARYFLFTLLVIGTAACAIKPDPSPLDHLHPCKNDEGPTDAYCGTLSVFENRETKQGRKISLWITVLPAIRSGATDPVVFLAGGPGQGAAQLARQIRGIFRKVQSSRDIILVDQRGTGKSNPLNCRSTANTLAQAMESDEVALDRLEECLKGYDADVRLYTTNIAMDDLDDVRAFLGYDKLNLYGGSYGTRAALVYLRRHGDHVRSMILDGVAPTDMRLPLFTSRDAQRALDKLLSDCESTPACNGRFPGLKTRVRTLLDRLERTPPRVRVAHPRTAIEEEVQVDARVVAGILFSALYSPLTASIVPTLIEDAEHNDFQALFALGLSGGDDTNMSLGMRFSVLCTEDADRVTTVDVARETAGTVFGRYLLGPQIAACQRWPRGTVERTFYDPVISDVPALVLSGDIDPVTPPSWGESVVKHLKNGRHVVMPATGHGVISTPCGLKLVQDFIDQASSASLDLGCVATVQRPPFFVTPAGPEATRGFVAAGQTGAIR
jgi:pimeloyl-ACP methyl ester carboxylesterase